MADYYVLSKALKKLSKNLKKKSKEFEKKKKTEEEKKGGKKSQATGKAHYSKNWNKAKQDAYNKKYYQEHKYKWKTNGSGKKKSSSSDDDDETKTKKKTSSKSSVSSKKKSTSTSSSSSKKSSGSSSSSKKSSGRKSSGSSSSSKKSSGRKSSGSSSSSGSSKKSSGSSSSSSTKSTSTKSKQTKPLTTKTKLTASQIEDGDEDIKLRTEADNIPDTNYYLFKGADGHFVLTDSDSTKWDLPTTINITDENRQEISERLKTLTNLFSDNIDTMAKWDKETSADVYEKATMYAFRGEMDKANELVTTGKISRKKKSSSVSHGGFEMVTSRYYLVGQHNDYISHHGIKGQRWGVRRYQNADGSLTAAGRKRLDQDVRNNAQRKKDKRTPVDQQHPENNVNRWVREDTERSKNLADQARSGTNAVSQAADAYSNIKRHNAQNKTERLDLSEYSDEELRKAVNRELLERQYNQVFNSPETTSRGAEKVKDIMAATGSTLAIVSSGLGIALAIKQLQGKS